MQVSITWNKKKGIWRECCIRWHNWRKPLSMNPKWRDLAPRKVWKRLKTTATGTLALLASATAWIRAQLSVTRWSLNIQYTTGPKPDSPREPSFRVRTRPAWTVIGDAVDAIVLPNVSTPQVLEGTSTVLCVASNQHTWFHSLSDTCIVHLLHCLPLDLGPN